MLATLFSWSLILLGISAGAIASFLIWLFTPPRNFPADIPTIPFYYALLPLFKDVDQAELYRQYLQEPLIRYGAVKLFFGGRWNILVTKPSFISEVFKYEDTYAKSGNQKKIPNSVLAHYTGDNIISAHGETWKLYTSVLKPGLQQDHDPMQIRQNTARLLELCFEQQKHSSTRSVIIPQLLQRFTLANLSEVLLGSNFQVRSTMISLPESLLTQR
jgi:cytochrome P450